MTTDHQAFFEKRPPVFQGKEGSGIVTSSIRFMALSSAEITMETPRSPDLADRVEHLERQCLHLQRANWHMKHLGGLAVIVAILMTLGGAQLAQRTEEIRAGSILLVDRGGFPRALLAVTPDPNSGAVLQLSHKGSKHPQMVLTVNKSNQVALSLLDSNQRPRIFLGLEPDGSPRLRLQDQDGNCLFQAPIEPNPTVPSMLRP
jgi:hypothetical protein